MKLLTVRESVYYIPGFVNIGVVVNHLGDALLVDAGLDSRYAQRIKAVLDQNQLTPKGIIITHAHADHYGGACYLSRITGARIYATSFEKGIIENPIQEAVSLFGGAYPPAEMRRKFFHAPMVAVDGTLSPGVAEIEGIRFEVVALPGHTIGQIGVAIEGVLFCADSIATLYQIKKQGLLKQASIKQAFSTFETLKSRNELFFVPSHGNILNDILPLVVENQNWTYHILSLIVSMCEEPIGVEDLLVRICADIGVIITSLSRYCVLRLSILACLGYLLDEQRILIEFIGGRQLFRRRGG